MSGQQQQQNFRPISFSHIYGASRDDITPVSMVDGFSPPPRFYCNQHLLFSRNYFYFTFLYSLTSLCLFICANQEPSFGGEYPIPKGVKSTRESQSQQDLYPQSQQHLQQQHQQQHKQMMNELFSNMMNFLIGKGLIDEDAYSQISRREIEQQYRQEQQTYFMHQMKAISQFYDQLTHPAQLQDYIDEHQQQNSNSRSRSHSPFNNQANPAAAAAASTHQYHESLKLTQQSKDFQAPSRDKQQDQPQRDYMKQDVNQRRDEPAMMPSMNHSLKPPRKLLDYDEIFNVTNSAFGENQTSNPSTQQPFQSEFDKQAINSAYHQEAMKQSAVANAGIGSKPFPNIPRSSAGAASVTAQSSTIPVNDFDEIPIASSGVNKNFEELIEEQMKKSNLTYADPFEVEPQQRKQSQQQQQQNVQQTNKKESRSKTESPGRFLKQGQGQGGRPSNKQPKIPPSNAKTRTEHSPEESVDAKLSRLNTALEDSQRKSRQITKDIGQSEIIDEGTLVNIPGRDSKVKLSSIEIDSNLEKLLVKKYTSSKLKDLQQELSRLQSYCTTARVLKSTLLEETRKFEEKKALFEAKCATERKELEEMKAELKRSTEHRVSSKSTAKNVVEIAEENKTITRYKEDLRTTREALEKLKTESKKKSEEISLALSNSMRDNKRLRQELAQANEQLAQSEDLKYLIAKDMPKPQEIQTESEGIKANASPLPSQLTIQSRSNSNNLKTLKELDKKRQSSNLIEDQEYSLNQTPFTLVLPRKVSAVTSIHAKVKSRGTSRHDDSESNASSMIADIIDKSHKKIPRYDPSLAKNAKKPKVEKQLRRLPLSLYKMIKNFGVADIGKRIDPAELVYCTNKHYLKYLEVVDSLINPKQSEKERDGSITLTFDMDIKKTVYKDNTKSFLFPSRYQIVFFTNEDVKQILPNGIEYYYFKSTGTTQTILPEGFTIVLFMNGQIEMTLPSGEKQVKFTDGMIKITKPDGEEHVLFQNGVIEIVDSSKVKTIKMPDGREKVLLPDEMEEKQALSSRSKKS